MIETHNDEKKPRPKFIHMTFEKKIYDKQRNKQKKKKKEKAANITRNK